MKNKQVLSWIIFLLFGQLVVSENSNSTKTQDLSLAEAKNGELEIIKSIKKINDDGSYTIGYEADDGSFKIESRDVLGNIKGTYGYLDENGDVKRISYTTNNTTDTTSTEAPSVVQRIPKTNKTSSNQNKPSILLYNPTTPLTLDLSQDGFSKPSSESESKIKTASKDNSKSKEVAKSSTSRSNIIYATSSPSNVIFSPRSLTRAQKSEGQLIRPEVVARRATELPAYRRAVSRQYALEEESSTPKTRSTLLRRQLVSESPVTFDPRKHIENLQQSIGDDSVDVYSASLSTATPRPLFTTTSRSRIFSTVKPPPTIENLTSRNLLQRVTTTEFSQNPSTESAASASTTPAPVHEQNVRESHQQMPYVQLRSPYNERVVLVPYNQVNAQANEQFNQPRPQPQLYFANGQYYKQVRVPAEAPQYQEQVQNLQPVIVRRPQIQKTIPAQVEASGYAAQVQPRATAAPYPLFLPAATPQRNFDNIREVENDVNYIKPPVSTKDFQKIIEYLILRQTKLEQANALINAQRERELLNLRKHRSHPTPLPLFVRRPQEIIQNGPVRFIADPQMARATHYITAPQMQVESQGQYSIRSEMEKNENSYDDYPSTSNSYTPTRRVARLLPPNPPKDPYENENFLPPQIREMLLLRMLQLAMNPSLPLESNESEAIQDSTPAEQQMRKSGIRNVQVLGEEDFDNLRTE